MRNIFCRVVKEQETLSDLNSRWHKVKVLFILTGSKTRREKITIFHFNAPCCWLLPSPTRHPHTHTHTHNADKGRQFGRDSGCVSVGLWLIHVKCHMMCCCLWLFEITVNFKPTVVFGVLTFLFMPLLNESNTFFSHHHSKWRLYMSSLDTG